jgi:glycerophosphoryl diester phosphodiesterase
MALALTRAARGGRFVRIGHKGAAALAPENTIESIAAALRHAVDVVEVDVVDTRDGNLVLAHSREEVAEGATPLDEALEFFAARSPAGTGLDLDLKWHGFEAAVADALRHHGLVERTLATSFFAQSLRTLRAIEPSLRTGISYPWDRHGISTKRAMWPLVVAGAAALRTALPHRIARMVERADAQAATLHFSVLSKAVVDRCHRLGLPVFAWTVDDAELLRRVLETGVDGVISNDPRIFGVDGESGSRASWSPPFE